MGLEDRGFFFDQTFFDPSSELSSIQQGGA
jgi:hypothetical protein